MAAKTKRSTTGSGHTPGPWFARERTCKRHAPGDPECYIGPDVMVRTKQDLPVAQCYGAPHRSINQTYANARLIAAAPEMWRILRETMDGHDATDRDANFRMCGCSVCHYVRPLLAKIDEGPDGG